MSAVDSLDLTDSLDSTLSDTAMPQQYGLRVVVVANVRLYREGLAAELSSRPGFSVVGSASDLDEAAGETANTQPDVVLLDIGMPGVIDLIHAIKAAHAEALIVVFGVDESEKDIEVCAEAGVAGFVTRDVTMDGLSAAIVAAAQGELRCSARTAALLFRRIGTLSKVGCAIRSEQTLFTTLTTREREIARLLANGKSNKEVSRTLMIELATVKNHVHHILEKLRVKTRTEVAARVRMLNAYTDRNESLRESRV